MRGCFSTISCERYCYPTGYEVTMASEHDLDITPRGTVAIEGTHLRRDTIIPQWFQASKAATASDGNAVHF